MKRFLCLIFAAALLLVSCGQSSPAGQEQDDNVVQHPPEGNYVEAEAAYTEFLLSGEYLKSLDGWLCGEPNIYAVADIGGDEQKELVISSDQADRGFCSFALFSYEKQNGEAKPVPIASSLLYGEGSSGGIGQYYGGMGYSPKHRSLVFTETNDSVLFGSVSYWALVDGRLEAHLTLVYDTDVETGRHTYRLYENGEETVIEESAFFAYEEESVGLDFEPIPVGNR